MQAVIKKQNKWRRGDKTNIAELAGITKQHLNEVLQRRCRITSREQADQLEQIAFSLGYAIPWNAWMLSTETENPYFSEKGE
jgi:transcriptional regulator with XRE-family HTH domain